MKYKVLLKKVLGKHDVLQVLALIHAIDSGETGTFSMVESGLMPCN